MASLAATNWPKPLVLVPCLSWSTASAVFTQGVMSHSINWDVLETQYFADGNYRETLSKMVTIIDDAFLAGQQFVKTYSKSMKELERDIKEMNELTSNDPVNLQSNRPRDGVKSRLIDIKTHKNQLDLSENLFNKLLSTERNELTSEEINELNTKIKLALKKIKAERGIEETNKNKGTVLNSNDENSKEKMVLQSDTSNNESSTYLSSAINVGRTKLMSLISPSSNTAKPATNENLPAPAAPRPKFDITKTNWWEREATQFMRGVMDECTHLKNFSVPYDTSLITAVCAKDDAYIPREGCMSLEDIWPGCEIKYLDAGHVSAYVLHQKLFRSSISEAFERAKLIYAEEHRHNQEFQQRRVVFTDSSSFKDRIKELQVLKP